jgi:hypothetical protein
MADNYERRTVGPTTKSLKSARRSDERELWTHKSPDPCALCSRLLSDTSRAESRLCEIGLHPTEIRPRSRLLAKISKIRQRVESHGTREGRR